MWGGVCRNTNIPFCALGALAVVFPPGRRARDVTDAMHHVVICRSKGTLVEKNGVCGSAARQRAVCEEEHVGLAVPQAALLDGDPRRCTPHDGGCAACVGSCAYVRVCVCMFMCVPPGVALGRAMAHVVWLSVCLVGVCAPRVFHRTCGVRLCAAPWYSVLCVDHWYVRCVLLHACQCTSAHNEYIRPIAAHAPRLSADTVAAVNPCSRKTLRACSEFEVYHQPLSPRLCLRHSWIEPLRRGVQVGLMGAVMGSLGSVILPLAVGQVRTSGGACAYWYQYIDCARREWGGEVCGGGPAVP